MLRNYAEALYEAAAARGEGEATVAALELLGGLVRTEPEVRRIARHPGISHERKLTFLGEALGARRTELVEDFLRLLLQRGRLGDLGEIADVLGRVAEEKAGRQTVRVETCAPLSADQAERLAAALGKIAGRPVALKLELAPDLLGGLRIQVDSEVLDETIAGRLARIEEHLTGPLS